MHCRCAEANRFRNLRRHRAREGETYYVATRTSGAVVEGKLPLTAQEALAFIACASGPFVEIRDAQRRTVSLEALREEVLRVTRT